MFRATAALAALIMGCQTANTAPRAGEATTPTPSEPASSSPSVPGSGPGTPPPDPLATLNAEARAGAVTESIGGVAVFDPYRTLESDSALTQRWIEQQTARTEQALAPYRDPTTEARLAELLSIGSIGSLDQGGTRLFFTLREGSREQAALYMFGDEGFVDHPLVDPLRVGPRAALDFARPSPRGRYVAYGLSDSGDERSVLHVLDVDAGKPLPETITHAKWSSIDWLQDESGFYYTRYPAAGEPHHDPEQEDSYFPAVRFHRLGTDPARDPLVFRSEVGTDFPVPSVGDDDRYLVVMNYRGWTASDVYLLDRGAVGRDRVDAPDEDHPLETVTAGSDKLTSGTVHGGKLLLITNEDAPRNRIVSVSPRAASDRTRWRTLVPESEAKIEDWTVTRGHLAVHRVRDIKSELSLFTLTGKPVGDVPLPADGSVDGLVSNPREDSVSFTFSSFFYAPALFRFTPGQAEAVQLYQVQNDLDTEAFTLARAHPASRDGTPINVFYLHRKDLVKDGSAPVLLNGYGGFDVSLLPSFTRTALYWVEQGGVYAVANLRGGGELGEEWHRAGMLKQKHRVFEDFEAAIDYFSVSGISRPDRIAITGGSNGGLLMGAMITRAPARFGAAIANVGLYDMMRYTHFPPAQLWVSEYGEPTDPDMAPYLHGYSPYHQVRTGTAYPAVLIETADHDTRVHWAHSTKLVARLQEATSADRPIYFFMERKMGHGRGTRLSDMVELYARRHAFLRAALHL